MKTGVIDIGSNSVRMAWVETPLCYGALPHESLRYSRLAEGATQTGVLSEAAVLRTADAILSLLDEAEENGAEIKRISATSALREAQNRDVAKTMLEEKIGHDITILDGREEARYSYKGATYGLPSQGRTLLVLDVGGGSSELCWGQEEGQSVSVPVGAVRLKENAELIGNLSQALRPLTQKAPKGSGVALVGVGGTLTTMAALYEGMQDYDARMIHQMSYGYEGIEQINNILKDMPMEKRLEFPSLASGRADIITQGLDIALEVMRELRAEIITVSTTDLLWGQLTELIDA